MNSTNVHVMYVYTFYVCLILNVHTSPCVHAVGTAMLLILTVDVLNGL